jgi:cytochrome b6-f complex iron-sulfur subunit
MTSEPIQPAVEEPASLDRRGALARLVQLAAGLLGLGALAGCPGGGRRPSSASLANFDRYEVKTREVPLNIGFELTLNGREAILIHFKSKGEDRWIAVDRRCSHAGCRLTWQTNGEKLVCPCHGSTFDPQGLPITGPATRPLRTWPVSISGGSAYIDTSKK